MIQNKTQLPINETRATILTHLLSRDMTAIDLEEKLEINESAIRRHLNTLEQRGFVEHYFEKASRGRPKKLYGITQRGQKIFPQKTHLLFVLLAKSVEEEYGQDNLESLLSHVAEKLTEKLTLQKSDKSKEAQIEKFVEFMDKFGFYPDLYKENGTYFIKYRNCVFGEVVEELCGKLCEMHKEIVLNIIPDCKVSLKQCIGQGKHTCVHQIIFEGDEC
ncbi:hypothetical protein AKJ50_00630 [candidate division MSBL1 archaeon SCGC-AAA382A13]|uniref:HTH arsR-type domain-containing protein n=1 Tax=candidate division MSBL1 archaeon SCGC-AAA382A13 TaxID=1698279 RepID=A0A133VGK2_9EURY|nr:hypothetical protein AKJ50_00630 [candidate division MSBL1 archaeon SCGC-AAA382A13]